MGINGCQWPLTAQSEHSEGCMWVMLPDSFLPRHGVLQSIPACSIYWGIPASESQPRQAHVSSSEKRDVTTQQHDQIR